MGAFEDAIADCVLDAFRALPAKCKPRVREDGRDWVPISGIVLEKGNAPLTCVSLGTGMKCLPSQKVRLASGVVLHDWHAEVLAMRAFNAFLVRECAGLAAGSNPSIFVGRRANVDITTSLYQPYAINGPVRIHMYCSEAPCGDASMELTMAAQEDATPWPLPASLQPSAGSVQTDSQSMYGRGYFSALGIVRRKPARPDAPQTLSKSCSDKIAQKQSTSLLSSLTSLLIQPSSAYLHTLILPESQHNLTATSRSFGATGRMATLLDENGRPQTWGGGYAFRPFQVRPTSRESDFSRRMRKPEEMLAPSSLSAIYTPHFQEVLIGGVLQGRKQFDPKGASMVCRRRMWSAVLDIAKLLGMPLLLHAVDGELYADVKKVDLLQDRNAVKDAVRSKALQGWVRNLEDEFSPT